MKKAAASLQRARDDGRFALLGISAFCGTCSNVIAELVRDFVMSVKGFSVKTVVDVAQTLLSLVFVCFLVRTEAVKKSMSLILFYIIILEWKTF